MSDPLRAFLIFDRSHDLDLRNELMRQAKRDELPFAIVAESEDESREDARVRTRVREADEVIVLCGQHTGDSLAVSAEFRIALEEEKPYLLIWGRRGIVCSKPSGAKSGDGMYMWSLPVLEQRNQEIQRRLRPRPVANSA